MTAVVDDDDDTENPYEECKEEANAGIPDATVNPDEVSVCRRGWEGSPSPRRAAPGTCYRQTEGMAPV